MDTVVLTIEVWPARQPEVDDLLKATFNTDIGSAKLDGYKRQGRAVAAGEPVVMAWWAPKHWMREVRWLRIQLAPWCPAHCRLLRRLLRLSSTRTPTGLLDRPPGVWVARFDVALDYAANPAWLILQRPLAKRFRMVENEDGAVTWYGGTRDEVYVRVYDCAERHNLPGPRTRIEAEVQPSPQVELRLLDAAVPRRDPHGRAPYRDGVLQPFRNIGLGALHAPDLDYGESALLAQARVYGVPWTLAHLDGSNPADASRLRGALEKAQRGLMLRPPSEWLDVTWVYLVEALRDRLLFRVDDGEDGSHWSDPPWSCEDDVDVSAAHPAKSPT